MTSNTENKKHPIEVIAEKLKMNVFHFIGVHGNHYAALDQEKYTHTHLPTEMGCVTKQEALDALHQKLIDITETRAY